MPPSIISETVKSQALKVKAASDVVMVRQGVRALAVEIGLNIVDQTKIITAASELARNTVVHGGGGDAMLEIVRDTVSRLGLRLSFEDRGPGIADLGRALSDGFTTGTGLGLGLGGARRLSSEFHIESVPGQGTKITILKWRG